MIIRIYDCWKKETEKLTHEEKGRLIDCLVDYAITGKDQAPEGNERFIYPVMADRIRRENETHERRNAEAKLQKAAADARLYRPERREDT